MSDVSTASNTVAVGGIEITSNTGTAESMVESLKSDKPDTGEPRIVVKDGAPVEADPEKERVSKAASELGKKGGEAAAKAKAAAAKGNGKPVAEGAEKPEPKAAPVADDMVGSEEPSAAPTDKRKGDPRFDLTARVREQSEQLRQVRERTERLERENAELRAKSNGAAPKEGERPAPAPALEGKPKEEDFETHEEYLDARDVYNRKQWEREAEVRSSAKAETDAIGAEVNAFMERMNSHPDASRIDPNLLRVLPSFAVPPEQRTRETEIAQEILRSPYSPELYLHFTDHPEDLREIASIDSRPGMQRAIARLEGRFEGGKQGAAPAKTPPAAAAKPPFRPVTASPHVGEPDIYGEIDFDTFAKRRKAK